MFSGCKLSFATKPLLKSVLSIGNEIMARIVFHYLRIKDVFQYFTRDACEGDRSIVTCILLVAFF